MGIAAIKKRKNYKGLGKDFIATDEQLKWDKFCIKNNIIISPSPVTTGFYPEEYNKLFKEMQLSEDCWIEIENKTLPISVSSSSLNYKTHLNDKLINYTIEINFAFDTINNIR